MLSDRTHVPRPWLPRCPVHPSSHPAFLAIPESSCPPCPCPLPPPRSSQKNSRCKASMDPSFHPPFHTLCLFPVLHFSYCALPFASEVHGAPVFTPAFWCTLRYQWLGCPPPSHPPSYRSIFVVLFYRKQGYCFRLLRTTHFPISSLFSGIFCFTLFCAHGADPVTFLRASVVLFFVYYHPWAGFFHPLVRLLVYTPLPKRCWLTAPFHSLHFPLSFQIWGFFLVSV